MPTPSSTSRKRLLQRLLLALIVLVPVAAVGSFWAINNSLRNAYAVWWVADMVIEYMKAHDGAWPKDYLDLREPYEICAGRSGRPWTFDDLRLRVDVDWKADPRELVKQVDAQGKATFRAVHLRDGGTSHWESMEPNQLILEYLRTRAAESREPE